MCCILRPLIAFLDPGRAAENGRVGNATQLLRGEVMALDPGSSSGGTLLDKAGKVKLLYLLFEGEGPGPVQ